MIRHGLKHVAVDKYSAGFLTTAFQELYLYVPLDDLGFIQKPITGHGLGATFEGF